MRALLVIPRPRATRPLVTLLAALVVAGCGDGRETPRSLDVEAPALESTPAVSRPEPTATRDEMLGRLSSAGLTVATRPADRVSKKIKRTLSSLPQPPADYFRLGVEGEGMIAFEFSSQDLARQMDALHDNGFRHRNWYFGGIVATDVTRRMEDALRP